MAGHKVIAQRIQSANCSRSGKECVDLVLVDHFPASATIGIGGYPFKHQRSGTNTQRPIHDIGMASDPTHVSGTPEHLILSVVENILKGTRSL